MIDFKQLEQRGCKERNHQSMKTILHKLGNPQDKLLTIHVAGTNGKGSTCNFINNILIADKKKVVMFTSPHLHVHNERIKLNGENISTQDYNDFYEQISSLDCDDKLGMFEIDFLVALLYATSQNVDYFICECGIGGLHDCTNVVKNSISIITSVGLDHQEILGNDLISIAKQKAGIIKNNSSCFSAVKPLELKQVIQTIAKQKNAELINVRQPCYQSSKYYYQDICIDNLVIPEYQCSNIALAIEVGKYLNIRNEVIIQGIKQSHWSGRFEVVSKDPLIIVDGAHNIAAISAVLQEFEHQTMEVVFAASDDKDYKEMLAMLKQKANQVYIADFNYYRCFDAFEVAKQNNLKYINNLRGWLKYRNKGSKPLLICGSLYFISEVLSWFDNDIG